MVYRDESLRRISRTYCPCVWTTYGEALSAESGFRIPHSFCSPMGSLSLLERTRVYPQSEKFFEEQFL